MAGRHLHFGRTGRPLEIASWHRRHDRPVSSPTRARSTFQTVISILSTSTTLRIVSNVAASPPISLRYVSFDGEEPGAEVVNEGRMVVRAGRRVRRRRSRSSTPLASSSPSTASSGLTIEGVAAQAGVAKTTIYRRYRSKDELALAVLIDMVEHVAAVPEPRRHAGGVVAFVDRAVQDPRHDADGPRDAGSRLRSRDGAEPGAGLSRAGRRGACRRGQAARRPRHRAWRSPSGRRLRARRTSSSSARSTTGCCSAAAARGGLASGSSTRCCRGSPRRRVTARARRWGRR